ncbi:MAG: lipoyl synthase [Deltaproteobacteria bacterium]|nr:lipoyl synthase [Deltaproteobacteria bacterium]
MTACCGNSNTEEVFEISRKNNIVVKKPSWIKSKAPGSQGYIETLKIVREHKLHTVCQEAMCPNIGECWSYKTATFMIMGDLCTRRCNFCSVKKGNSKTLMPLDPLEPKRVALAARLMGLRHVVVTSVNRDDLSDNGAFHIAETANWINHLIPDAVVELLIPDLQGSLKDLETIMRSSVKVLNHNLETVPSLYRKVRPFADYRRSLQILRYSKLFKPSVKTKSGIMVGLGEKVSEVLSLMNDLRENDVDILTIGQYLRPTNRQMPVKEWIRPELFEFYREEGVKRGFKHVESGPLVRSSYHAWKHAS